MVIVGITSKRQQRRPLIHDLLSYLRGGQKDKDKDKDKNKDRLCASTGSETQCHESQWETICTHRFSRSKTTPVMPG